MTEHTKTPWRVEEGTDLIWGDCNPDDPTTYGMGYSIVSGHTAHHQRGKPSIDEREANAAFIVHAVNSHDTLLELAAEAMWRRDYPTGGSVYKTYESLSYRDKEIYRAEALSLAKGEA